MSELKDLRISKELTQKQAASEVGISLRSYITYETEPSKQDTPKYRFILHELNNVNILDETHGVLTIDKIKEICSKIFQEYNVNYCYLFGSYAKGKARETSDVDLLISTETTGLKFYGLTEELREALHKQVDLLDKKQLINNEALLDEILKEGIKIYG